MMAVLRGDDWERVYFGLLWLWHGGERFLLNSVDRSQYEETGCGVCPDFRPQRPAVEKART